MKDLTEMEQGNGRMSVPTFGEWEEKDGPPDYSLDFSKIRENRRQNKSLMSIGYEEELLTGFTNNGDPTEPLQENRPFHGHHSSPTKRKKITSYFSCYGCMGVQC